MADFDDHEGYDPRRRDEETAKPKKTDDKPKVEVPKPEPKKSDH